MFRRVSLFSTKVKKEKIRFFLCVLFKTQYTVNQRLNKL